MSKKSVYFIRCDDTFVHAFLQATDHEALCGATTKFLHAANEEDFVCDECKALSEKETS